MSALCVRPLKITEERLLWIMNELRQHPLLWDDETLENPLPAMASMMLSPTNYWQEICADPHAAPGGVIWYTMDGSAAAVHTVIWEPACMGQAARIGRLSLREFFQRFPHVRRVQATIPEVNSLALRFARQAGLSEDGCVRRVGIYEGRPVDGRLFSVFPDEVPHDE